MNQKVKNMVGIAFLIAIIVVVQIVGSSIRIGAFSISLVLLPIVVGAALYGATAGALFGFSFAVVVLISCITGVDTGGFILWSSNPIATAVVVLLKGVAAGWAAGMIYSLISKKNVYIGVICASIVCPIVNTGIFCLAMALIFRSELTIWAGGTNLVYYTLVGLVGINFLIEAAVNVVLSPTIVRIIRIGKKVRD